MTENASHEITIVINGKPITIPDGEYTGAQLKGFGKVPPGEALFLKHGHGKEERITDDQVVKVHPNMEFESAPDGGVS